MINRLSKIKTLIGVIIFLLLTNLVLLYFTVFEKGNVNNVNKERENSTTNLLQKEVGFSENQIVQYKKIKEAHYKTTKPYFENLKVAKRSLYRLLPEAHINDSVLHSSAYKIGEQENELNLQLFNFYKTARQICRPDQLPAYDSLIIRQMSDRGRRSGRK